MSFSTSLGNQNDYKEIQSHSDNTDSNSESDMNLNFEGKSFSLSSWPNIPISDLNDPSDEELSLSLRAKLLYGEHSFESLVEDGSFGNRLQIINTLKACYDLGVLVIHNSINNHEDTEAKREKTSFRKSIYAKLSRWLG